MGRKGVTCRNPTTDRQHTSRLYAPTIMRVPWSFISVHLLYGYR
jgi:hypothetical protein